MLAPMPLHAARAYGVPRRRPWHESAAAVLQTVNAAIDRTPWADDAADDAWVAVRLTGRQIREIRAAVAIAADVVERNVRIVEGA